MKIFFTKRKSLRDKCIEAYGEEFGKIYDSLSCGVPVGGFRETEVILQMIEEVKNNRIVKHIDADKKAVKEITKTVRKEITSQVKEMMDSLDEKIAKATKSWKGVDVDKFMDEMRGREPEVDLE